MLVVTRAQRAPEKIVRHKMLKVSHSSKSKLIKTLKVGEAIAVP